MPEQNPAPETKEELQARLRLFPGYVDFTELSDGRFCSWINGHCFLWQQKDGKWECDEL